MRRGNKSSASWHCQRHFLGLPWVVRRHWRNRCACRAEARAEARAGFTVGFTWMCLKSPRPPTIVRMSQAVKVAMARVICAFGATGLKHRQKTRKVRPAMGQKLHEGERLREAKDGQGQFSDMKRSSDCAMVTANSGDQLTKRNGNPLETT